MSHVLTLNRTHVLIGVQVYNVMAQVIGAIDANNGLSRAEPHNPRPCFTRLRAKNECGNHQTAKNNAMFLNKADSSRVVHWGDTGPVASRVGIKGNPNGLLVTNNTKNEVNQCERVRRHTHVDGMVM
jgi:hypothetical protein